MIVSAWINPQGDIIPVSPHKHAQYASTILTQTTTKGDQVIIELVLRGWLHIGLAQFISFTKFVDLPDQQHTAILSLLDQTDGLVKQNIISYIHS